MRSFRFHLCFLAVSIVLSAGAPAWAQGQDFIRIGVLAYRGASQAVRRWAPTIRYLNRAVPGQRFELVPLGLQAMEDAVAGGEIDFLATNPGHYVVLESRYGVTRIATLRNRSRDRVLTRFGAVIFVRADRDDIGSLDELRGRSFMAVSPHAFGGFQMAWRELLHHDVDPFDDLRELHFAGFPQDRIVFAVRDGEVDAGTVRTDTLEHMAREGLIELDEFRVLNPRKVNGFPSLLSTALYPEWPFARVAHTPDTLAQQVAVALLTLTPGTDADAQGAYAGWTIPLDYSPVHELFRELGIGPYEDLGRITPGAVVRAYAPWLGVVLLVLLSLGAATTLVARANRRLAASRTALQAEISERRQAQEDLARHRDTLERRVGDRTRELARVNLELQQDVAARQRAEESLRRSDTTLRRLYTIISTRGRRHEQALGEMLVAGREHFGLSAGVIAQVVSGRYSVCCVHGLPGVESGASFPIGQVPANELLQGQGIVEHDNADEWPGREVLAAPFNGFQAYLGIPIVVGGAQRCVLELIGASPLSERCSAMDHDVLRLMAQWIGGEMDRQEAEERARRHQDELAHVARLSAVGEMATTLAHELNQPLTAVVNYTGGCVRRLRSGNTVQSELTSAMESAVAEATRAGKIVRHLRAFVRKGDEQAALVDLNEAVNNVLSLAEPRARRDDIEIVVQPSPGLPAVEGNPIQLEQVILNLINNAMDAIRTGAGDAPRRIELRTGIPQESGWVRVSVGDTGPGLGEGPPDELFEPFHTTREDGMGMGLSISRSIVESLGGRIGGRNLPRRGAEFWFELRGAAAHE